MLELLFLRFKVHKKIDEFIFRSEMQICARAQITIRKTEDDTTNPRSLYQKWRRGSDSNRRGTVLQTAA